MESNYSNLLYIRARSPEKLKEQLIAIDVPSQIVSGSWDYSGSRYGVWVMLDRPVERVRRKDLKMVQEDLLTNTKTKTTILKKED